MNASLLSNAEERIKRNRADLAKIISNLFSYNELKRFVDFYLQTDHEIISIPDDKNDFIYDMLGYFQRRSRLNEVVMGIRQWRPNDPELYGYSMKVGLAAEIITPDVANFDLEALINQETGISNLRQWRLKLGEIENQVCLIKIKKDDSSQPIPNGTGFLISNDLVLTNWHVVNPFIDTSGNPKQIKADTITAHFGFFAELDTNTAKTGKEYLLDPSSWLVAHSPQSELDYALLKLEKNAAAESAGGEDNYMDRRQDTTLIKRGYITIPDQVSLNESMPLFILQHPGGTPMGIAVNFVSKLDNANSRIQYKTDTLKGSSGSPCFDAKWNLVALHHAAIESLAGKSNEGIPINKIHESLKSKNINLE